MHNNRMSNNCDSGSMKRSFSDMENNVSLPTPPTPPTGFRDGYYIAIRGKGVPDATAKAAMRMTSYRSSCIFGSWDDAQSHLQKVKAEGRILEYDAFEKIDDATQYAFGKNKDNHLSPDTNDASSISPYREKEVEVEWSPFSDATLSDLEELPQDVLTNVFTYICPGSNYHFEVNQMISIVGMTSKKIYQTCVRYVQQEPFRFYAVQNHFKTMAFFLRNSAKVKVCIGYQCDSLSGYIIWWLILKYCDLSAMKSMVLPYHSGSFASITADEKWKLVEDEITSVRDVKKLCKKSDDDIQIVDSQYFTASRCPSLEKIEMNVFPKSFEIYNSLFLCTIDRLMHLEFNFHNTSNADGAILEADKKAAFKKIEQLVCIAPRLKKLTLSRGWGGTIFDVKIQSKSLESIWFDWSDTTNEGALIQTFSMNCPSLTTLMVPIALDVFDPSRFVRINRCELIEVLDITFDRLHGRHAEEDPSKRKQLFEMLGQMPSLKELHLDDRCNNFLEEVYLDVPSVDRLVISSKGLETIIHRCTSLKTLELYLENLPNFDNLRFNLENVKEFRICADNDVEDAQLATLSQTIEERMPKLESFELDFGWTDTELDEFTFVLKSKSLKKVNLPKYRVVELDMVVELDCPSLETLNGKELKDLNVKLNKEGQAVVKISSRFE